MLGATELAPDCPRTAEPPFAPTPKNVLAVDTTPESPTPPTAEKISGSRNAARSTNSESTGCREAAAAAAFTYAESADRDVGARVSGLLPADPAVPPAPTVTVCEAPTVAAVTKMRE